MPPFVDEIPDGVWIGVTGEGLLVAARVEQQREGCLKKKKDQLALAQWG